MPSLQAVWGGTYAGNPIACVAALEVLKVFEQENLLQKANDLGQKLKDGLLAIAEKHPEIGDVTRAGSDDRHRAV